VLGRGLVLGKDRHPHKKRDAMALEKKWWLRAGCAILVLIAFFGLILFSVLAAYFGWWEGILK
jgi:hypothetical protein